MNFVDSSNAVFCGEIYLLLDDNVPPNHQVSAAVSQYLEQHIFSRDIQIGGRALTKHIDGY